jgi:excisionase family DNA binding protein
VSALEETFAEIVRQVVREELKSFHGSQPEELLTAEGVARLLGVKKQKVYALAREHEIEPVMISQREMRFSPQVVREFQLRKGIRAA